MYISSKTKQILNILSFFGMIPPIFLAILLPQPYSDGVHSDVFGDNILAILLFVFLCLSISCGSFCLYYFTNIWTKNKLATLIGNVSVTPEFFGMSNVLLEWKKQLHEAEKLTNEELKKKQQEYINDISKIWESEKLVQSKADEELKKINEQIEILQKENEALRNQQKNDIDKYVMENRNNGNF